MCAMCCVHTILQNVERQFKRGMAGRLQRAHDKAFYKLCTHMEPDYHQLEFEVRVYLTHLEASGQRLWARS